MDGAREARGLGHSRAPISAGKVQEWKGAAGFPSPPLDTNAPLPPKVPLGAQAPILLSHSMSPGQVAKPFLTLLPSLAKWG